MSLESAVRNVHDFESLIDLLATELKWDIEVGSIEDLTFEWSADDLRVSEPAAKKLQHGSVFQLRPPSTIKNPPWGIFFIKFADDKIYRGVLRQVLRALVPKQRSQTHLPTWQHENLLFICATKDYEQFTFAHFKGLKAERAVLSSFSWVRDDTHIRTLAEFNLPALSWPQDESASELWLKKWSAAFDVERVTDQFFISYRSVFEKFENEVLRTIPNHDQARLYTQRLFNRLMFVYFIQKKGWLSYRDDHNYLRAVFTAAEDNDESFLHTRLRWLFFYGLGNAGLILDPRLQDFLESRIGKVPFLNGGLFDIEDSYDAELSDDNKLQAASVKISNKAFGEVLDLFERYNFTIEESTPLDVQVAVDPEMLGKVFEELVTGRHETGSYYTPRPVVAFMCREALKHYLGRVQPNPDAIALFVDEGNTSLLTDPEAVLTSLKRVRVCDPACGSGAYLLGMLQELLRLRDALFKDYKIDFSKLYDRKREVIEKNLYGVDKDKFAVQIACLRLWLSLAIESDEPKPLPNLDFKIGCDDSLTGPPPHETQPDMFRVEKVRQYRDKKSQFLKCDDPDLKRRLRDEIFALRDEIAIGLNHNPPIPNPQRLMLTQDRVNQLSKEIKQLVRENDKANAAVKQAQLKKLQRQLESWKSVRLTKPTGFDWTVEFAEIFMPQTSETWRIDDLHPLLNEFKNQPILVEQAKTEDGGFDIVVANPPYVRADAQFKHIQNEMERRAAITEWKRFRAALLKTDFYKTIFEKWDLYLPFLERGYQLLRKGGDMVFIISDAYNTAKYAARSHLFFVANSRIERLDFCSEIPLFKAGVNNTIIHFSRSDLNDGHKPVRIRRWGDRPDEFEHNKELLPTSIQRQFGVELFRPDRDSIDSRRNEFVDLGRICYISVGMVIHCDEKKAQGLFKAEDLISDHLDARHPKAYVEGKDIARWKVRRVRFLEYGTRRAPAMFRRPTFPELHSANERLIALRMCGIEPTVAYDDRQLLSNHTVIIFIPWWKLKGTKNKSIRKTAKYRNEVKATQAHPLFFREQLEELSHRFEAKYLLAIMNSSFAKDFVNNRRRSKLDIYPDDWKALPIPPIPVIEQQQFVRLVNAILTELQTTNNTIQANTTRRVQELEREIDERVAELYSVSKQPESPSS